MLKTIRRTLAIVCFALITLLFLDFTGTAHGCVGWLAKIQFLPALLVLNVGIIVGLILLTLLLGRVYCSVICPLGVLQDLFSWMAGRSKKNRFHYTTEKAWLRYTMLALFVVAMLVGFASWAALIEPYSAYGRMANNLFQYLWISGNNLAAGISESNGSYAFYHVEPWIRSWYTWGIAFVSFLVILFLSWSKGRLYCNTICPVGTVLSFFARFSILKPVIDTTKCNSCGRCGRNCKASCIDTKNHQIDYSRCVACMDCIEECRQGAIHFSRPIKLATAANEKSSKADPTGRRAFFTLTAVATAHAVLKAQDKKPAVQLEKSVDGGYATIIPKQIPHRENPITPPGSLSASHFSQHCTACQLCVSACPNNVLRPSTDLDRFMQPELSYEKGYCRPECVRCSEVCPSGAIRPITKAEKSSTKIGHAVLNHENCIVNRDGMQCNNCARHCPVQAILMVQKDPNDPKSLLIPVVNEERCIGCGACENLCPSRPISAIHVEGDQQHKNV